MRVASLTKVSEYSRLMEFEVMRKAAGLNEAKERGATVKSSELKGSNHRGPARRHICNYIFYNLRKDVTKFIWAEGGRSKTVFAISKKGSHQQPSSTGSIWNILTRRPVRRAIISDSLWCVYMLSTMSSFV